MEVKIPEACPLWLSEMMDRYQQSPSSFSKYGFAYKKANCISSK